MVFFGGPRVCAGIAVVPPELVGTELADAQKALAARVKAKHEEKLDRLKQEIDDTIRFYEAGWKDRYYADKLKKQNLEKGGGQQRMFQKYVEGLCWVYLYYYRGCQSWDWYYPFHYAPFSSDLVNIERSVHLLNTHTASCLSMQLRTETARYGCACLSTVLDRYAIKFEMGEPLRPIEQLMAVLPPESADALPLPFARLMTDPESPLKDFYPRDGECLS